MPNKKRFSPPGLARAWPAMVVLALTSASCSYVSDDGTFGNETFGLRLVRSAPPGGASDVAVDSPIDLYFDRPLATESLDQATLQLLSGRVRILGGVKTDLLEQRLRFTPDGDLRADLQYQLFVASDLRSLDGALLDEPLVIGFTTGAERQGTPGDEPSVVTAADLQSVWEARGCIGCHEPPDAAAGVDLSSRQATVRTLRRVRSLGSPLQRVTPGDHASSYLLRKLLGEAGTTGFRMPPNAPRLPDDELRQIADWIDTGARE